MIELLGVAAGVAGCLAYVLGRRSSIGAPRAVSLQVVASMVMAVLFEVCAQLQRSGEPILAVAWGVFAAVMVAQVVIDLRTRTLPRRLSHAGLAIVALLMVLGGSSGDGTQLVLGALLMTAITGVLVLISRGSLGVGDLHFSPLLGAAIGWFAPSLVVVAWIVASSSAAVIVIMLLSMGRITRQTRIPYGPFLAFGTTAAICVGAVR